MGVRSAVSSGAILVPTDFQQASRRAVHYGVAMALLFGARLVLLHVIKALPGGGVSSFPPGSRAVNAMKTAALLELGRLARSVRDSGVHAEARVEYGVPDACIRETANRLRPSLIVMGTEGRTGWDRLRLGSTANALVRQACEPVLVVHGGLAGDVLHHPARAKLIRLLVATDFSSCARGAVEAASMIGHLTQGLICVVHVAGSADTEFVGRRRIEAVVRRLRANGRGAEGACLVGEPIEAILAQAAQWQADLIVVGTQGLRGRLSRLVLGSVAEGLLRRAGCPVMVVRRAASLLRAASGGGRGTGRR